MLNVHIMKKVTITIDEVTLRLLDELVASSQQYRSRSALVRAALHAFAERENRHKAEEREDNILHTYRKRLAEQVHALVTEQAQL